MNHEPLDHLPRCRAAARPGPAPLPRANYPPRHAHWLHARAARERRCGDGGRAARIGVCCPWRCRSSCSGFPRHELLDRHCDQLSPDASRRGLCALPGNARRLAGNPKPSKSSILGWLDPEQLASLDRGHYSLLARRSWLHRSDLHAGGRRQLVPWDHGDYHKRRCGAWPGAGAIASASSIDSLAGSQVHRDAESVRFLRARLGGYYPVSLQPGDRPGRGGRSSSRTWDGLSNPSRAWLPGVDDGSPWWSSVAHRDRFAALGLLAPPELGNLAGLLLARLKPSDGATERVLGALPERGDGSKNRHGKESDKQRGFDKGRSSVLAGWFSGHGSVNGSRSRKL
jgi:hypothetical protein